MVGRARPSGPRIESGVTVTVAQAVVEGLCVELYYLTRASIGPPGRYPGVVVDVGLGARTGEVFPGEGRGPGARQRFNSFSINTVLRTVLGPGLRRGTV